MPDNKEEKLLILQLPEDSRKPPGFSQMKPQSEFSKCLMTESKINYKTEQNIKNN
jgi:hypothetical protein